MNQPTLTTTARTVLRIVTGFLFAEQSVDAVAGAMQRSLSMPLSAADLRASALRFDKERFWHRFEDAIDIALGERSRAVPDYVTKVKQGTA